MKMRSGDWYGGNSKDAYIHRAWMRRGNPDSALDGTRPQIAILNTASDLSPCNMHLDEVAQSVKNGIWEAGGVPYNLPMVSLGESNVRPTAALWRNMVAMSTEEMIRANPVDGVVLLGAIKLFQRFSWELHQSIFQQLLSLADRCLTEHSKENF
jgi:dihydroxy-acid dehydratase